VSRTEKTQPHWVKRFEWYREVHNHIKGYCDLPESPRAQGNGWPQNWRVACYYDCDWDKPIYRCGCGMCGYPSRSKQLRQEGKRQVREWWREYEDV
jgi:hypothetical protein